MKTVTITKVTSIADIKKAKQDNKTGIIFGFQNAHAFEDNLGYIQAFKDLGVSVVQMAYNTQNLICTSCYERDGGLSDYGREVVAIMNEVGILCDLSHVGAQSSQDVIETSENLCATHTVCQLA